MHNKCCRIVSQIKQIAAEIQVGAVDFKTTAGRLLVHRLVRVQSVFLTCDFCTLQVSCIYFKFGKIICENCKYKSNSDYPER